MRTKWTNYGAIEEGHPRREGTHRVAKIECLAAIIVEGVGIAGILGNRIARYTVIQFWEFAIWWIYLNLKWMHYSSFNTNFRIIKFWRLVASSKF